LVGTQPASDAGSHPLRLASMSTKAMTNSETSPVAKALWTRRLSHRVWSHSKAT
jgi:hypothetical protein